MHLYFNKCTHVPVPGDSCTGADNTNCGYTNGKCVSDTCGCDVTYKESGSTCIAKGIPYIVFYNLF